MQELGMPKLSRLHALNLTIPTVFSYHTRTCVFLCSCPMRQRTFPVGSISVNVAFLEVHPFEGDSGQPYGIGGLPCVYIP